MPKDDNSNNVNEYASEDEEYDNKFRKLKSFEDIMSYKIKDKKISIELYLDSLDSRKIHVLTRFNYFKY